jgi:hypothetical protein
VKATKASVQKEKTIIREGEGIVVSARTVTVGTVVLRGNVEGAGAREKTLALDIEDMKIMTEGDPLVMELERMSPKVGHL